MGITEVWVDTALALGDRSLQDHGPHRPRAGTPLGSRSRRLMDRPRSTARPDVSLRQISCFRCRARQRCPRASSAARPCAMRSRSTDSRGRHSRVSCHSGNAHPLAAGRGELAPGPGCSTRPSARAHGRALPSQSPASPDFSSAARHVSASRRHCAMNSRTNVLAHAERSRVPPARPDRNRRPTSAARCARLVACAFACPLMATSASVSSRRAATTGLGRNARAPACSQRWIASGVTSALSTMTGVRLPPPASITRNCAQQVQAADARACAGRRSPRRSRSPPAHRAPLRRRRR